MKNAICTLDNRRNPFFINCLDYSLISKGSSLFIIVIYCNRSFREERECATSIIVRFIWFLRFCIMTWKTYGWFIYNLHHDNINRGAGNDNSLGGWAMSARISSLSRPRFPFRCDPARCTCVITSPVVIA